MPKTKANKSARTFKLNNTYFNPLKDLRFKKKEGWDIGPVRVLLPLNHKDKKKIRNIIVSEKKIKALVFGKKD